VAAVRDDSALPSTHDIAEAVYWSDRVVALPKSPTTVVDVITTELPRPRDQIVTKPYRSLWRERSEIACLIRRRAAAPCRRA
jgi:NitT/TauT family transport system ATP-binding protein